MSCKSAIYTVNSGAQSVAVGGTINLGSIIRRFGQCLDLNGTGISLNDGGFYDIDVSVTAAPTAAGAVTITLLRDGVAVPGATASAATSTAGNSVNLSIASIVRNFCNCSGSTLTLVLSGTSSTVTNVAVVVERI